MHIQLGFITISHYEKEKLKLYGCHIVDCRVNMCSFSVWYLSHPYYLSIRL